MFGVGPHQQPECQSLSLSLPCRGALNARLLLFGSFYNWEDGVPDTRVSPQHRDPHSGIPNFGEAPFLHVPPV